MAEVVRFWRGRGVDGFRVDALQALAKDPLLRDDPPATRRWELPLPDELTALDLVHSRGAEGAEGILAGIREGAGDALLVGEIYLPSARLGPYLDHVDAAFSFEFLHAERDAARLASIIFAAAAGGRTAWALSNHDFPRLVGRFGPAHARLAAVLLLSLPGLAFIYQGDEIGMTNGPAADPPLDRHGRDPFRTPMRWDTSPSGGFTSGDSWLPLAGAETPSVAAQEGDEDSMLNLYRRLIELRPSLGPGIDEIGARDGRPSLSPRRPPGRAEPLRRRAAGGGERRVGALHGSRPPRGEPCAGRGNDRPSPGLIVVPLGTCIGGEDELPEGETRGRSGTDAAGSDGALRVHGLRFG